MQCFIIHLISLFKTAALQILTTVAAKTVLITLKLESLLDGQLQGLMCPLQRFSVGGIAIVNRTTLILEEKVDSSIDE